MSGVLFYITTIGFTLGILIRSFVSVGLSEVVFLLLISFVFAVLYRRKIAVFSAKYLLYVSVFLLVFAFGVLRMEVASHNAFNAVYEAQVGEEVHLEGVVAREVDVRENTTHVYVRTENGSVLVIADRFAGVLYGDRLLVKGVLSKPEPFATDLGRTFNYPGYLQAQGVAYTIRYADITKTGQGQGNVLIAYLLHAKHAFMDTIESTIPEPQAGLSEGLLLGVKKALGEDLETAFRKTGIIHIVVLSGYNIMLVVAFVLYVLSYILPFRGRLIVGGISIVCFALIVGLSATVVRASLMATLALVAMATGRTYAVLRSLTLAGIAMIMINPYLLAFDVGFQLSFIATFGLIVLAPLIEQKIQRMSNVIGLREIFVATLSTQIFVLPLLLYQIGEFSVVAVLVNLLVLPMVPIAMLLTFITGVVGLVSPTLAVVPAFFATLSLSFIIGIAEFFAALPFASFVVPAFSFAWVVVAYVLLFVWMYYDFAKNSTPAGVIIEKEAPYSAPTQIPIVFR